MKETICKTCMFLTMCRTGQDVINRREIALLGCSKFKKQEPKTNADVLRGMTDEELARIFAKLTDRDKFPQFNGSFMSGNYDVILEWLKAEATE